jgi:hypothetical protein
MPQRSTIRRVVTLLLLLLAATEIFACDMASSQACLFSTHTTQDSGDDCAGDGCLCCCAHIVVAPMIAPPAPLGLIAATVPCNDIQTPDFPPRRIEHPPRA